jgi:hypothetical protein
MGREQRANPIAQDRVKGLIAPKPPLKPDTTVVQSRGDLASALSVLFGVALVSRAIARVDERNI